MGQREHQSQSHIFPFGQMLDLGLQRHLEIADIGQRQLMIPCGIKRRDEPQNLLDTHLPVHDLIFGQIADPGTHC